MQTVTFIFVIVFGPLALFALGAIAWKLTYGRGKKSYDKKAYAKDTHKFDLKMRAKELDEERAVGLTYPPRVKMPQHVASHAAPAPAKVKSGRPAGHGGAGSRPPANVIASMPKKDNNWAGVPVGVPF